MNATDSFLKRNHKPKKEKREIAVTSTSDQDQIPPGSLYSIDNKENSLITLCSWQWRRKKNNAIGILKYPISTVVNKRSRIWETKATNYIKTLMELFFEERQTINKERKWCWWGKTPKSLEPRRRQAQLNRLRVNCLTFWKNRNSS